MDNETKQRWVEALRSGKYEQGRGNLNNNGKFCCLGVLVDITHPDMWIEVDPTFGQYAIPHNSTYGFETDDGMYDDANVFDGSLDRKRTSLAPNELEGEWLEHYGLEGRDASQLMRMNDGPTGPSCDRKGHSFDEIADWIEENI